MEGLRTNCLKRRVRAGKGELPFEVIKSILPNALQGLQSVECDDRIGIAVVSEGVQINYLKCRVLAGNGELPIKVAG